MRGYTIIQWVTFFYIYGFLGWIWESCYVSIKKGKWINRGFLRGPFLPIYGSGAVMMLIVSMPFQGNLVLTYIAGVAGATLLEYVTGWVMERIFKVRYWDYSSHRLNLHGYICLTSSVAWGFFTIIMTEVLHPPVEQAVQKGMSRDANIIFVCVVSVVFVIDTVISAKAALDMAKVLESMGKIRNELEYIQVQMALLKKETSDYMEANLNGVMDKVDEWKIKAMNVKDQSTERTAAVKESVASKLEKLKELDTRKSQLTLNREDLLKGVSFRQKGLLRGNPTASAGRFEKSFKELKDKFIKQN